MSDSSPHIVSLDSYLTLKEVTTNIKVASSTLYRWIADGKFPKPVRLGENCVRWRVSDLKAWQDSRHTGEPVKKAC
ncbi:AlpA family phage regulatory protein [Rhizobium skierniewicense]|uniref:helix-turn-helix transcriptional regulator n=1 Tax=Rhizobium skierniewicense TaxID=984260 RepID=UPI001FAD0ECE|nr:AlpA family phage regulatory protein [Rhizobium skierniewicense]MCI9865562.1 AlpA family phage regulatory protein [Rhizobium skierniewicense]